MTDTNRQNPDWTDERLTEAIRSGGPPREAALQAIYQRPGLRETVIRQVLDQGGTRDDAMDVFQETLVLFDRNLREGRFEGRSALSTYFVGIAKWRWLTMRRQKGRFTELSPEQHERPGRKPGTRGAARRTPRLAGSSPGSARGTVPPVTAAV